jgi:hypothetical protein
MKHGVVGAMAFRVEDINDISSPGCDPASTQPCHVVDLVRIMCGIRTNQSSGPDRLSNE